MGYRWCMFCQWYWPDTVLHPCIGPVTDLQPEPQREQPDATGCLSGAGDEPKGAAKSAVIIPSKAEDLGKSGISSQAPNPGNG